MRVFLSYRRDDDSFVTGRLRDRLANDFGYENIFFDVDSIPFGTDFREAILGRINEADVVLALIGSRWDSTRLADIEDYVRMEIVESLRLHKLLIPVLIGETQMPGSGELPKELQSMAFLNAIRLRPDPDFAGDSARLVTAVRDANKRQLTRRVEDEGASVVPGGKRAATTLEPDDRNLLKELLIRAYPDFNNLEQFLDSNLDKDLSRIVPQSQNHETIVFKLIRTAIAEEWLEKLVRALVEHRPANDELRRLAIRLGIDEPRNRNPNRNPPPAAQPLRPKAAAPADQPTSSSAGDAPSEPVVRPGDVAPTNGGATELPPDLARFARDYVDQMGRPDTNRRTLALERLLDGLRRHDTNDVPLPTMTAYILSPNAGTRIVGITVASLRPDNALVGALLAVARQPLSDFEQYHAIHALQAAVENLSRDNCLEVRGYLRARLDEWGFPAAARALSEATLATLDCRPRDILGDQ